MLKKLPLISQYKCICKNGSHSLRSIAITLNAPITTNRLLFSSAEMFKKPLIQGSYASGKCQGNLNFFKVRELSGNFMLSVKNGYLQKCQGIL